MWQGAARRVMQFQIFFKIFTFSSLLVAIGRGRVGGSVWSGVLNVARITTE